MAYNPDTNDLMIVVIGPTGSGKTRFINALLGRAEPSGGGDGLAYNAGSIRPYIIPNSPVQLPGRSRLVLFDTPGLNEDVSPDATMVRKIFSKLKAKYSNNISRGLIGLIYLHRITDNRVRTSGSIYGETQTLCRCFGNIAPTRVCFVTTMWNNVTDKQTAENRERELIGDFWQPLINEGAKTGRFDNSSTSARNIVADLLIQDGVAIWPNPGDGGAADNVPRCCCWF